MKNSTIDKIVGVAGLVAVILVIIFREWLRCHPVVSGCILFGSMFGMLACIGYYIWESTNRK